MKDKFLVVAGCLLLVLVVHLEFSKAQETTTIVDEAISEKNNLEDVLKKSYDASMKAYEHLKMEKDETIKKIQYLQENRRPFPNISEMINVDKDVESLKTELKKVSNVTKREQCTKLFDDNVKIVIEEMKVRMLSDYNGALAKLSSVIQNDTLEDDKDNFVKDYNGLLERCKQTNWHCDAKAVDKKWYSEIIEHVKGIVREADARIFQAAHNALWHKINNSLKKPVKACINQ